MQRLLLAILYICLTLATPAWQQPTPSPSKEEFYFYDLREFVAKYITRKHETRSIWNYTLLASLTQGQLEDEYPDCNWAVAIFMNSPDDPIPPGYSSGAMDSTGCDVDKPPNECKTSGGLVHMHLPLTAFGLELQIVLFFTPVAEMFALREGAVSEEELDEYEDVILDGLHGCPMPDRTEFAFCVMHDVADSGLQQPRGFLIAPSDSFALYGGRGGLMVPGLRITVRVRKHIIVTLAVLALPPQSEMSLQPHMAPPPLMPPPGI